MESLPRRLGIAWTLTWVHLGILVAMLMPQVGEPLRVFGAGIAQVGSFESGSSGTGVALQVLAILATGTLLYFWSRGEHLRWAFLGAGAINLLVTPVGLAPAALYFWLSRQDLEDAAGRMPVPGGAAKTRIVLAWLVANALLVIVNIPILFLIDGLMVLWFPATAATALLPGLLIWRLFSTRPEREVLHVMPQLPEFRSP